MLFLMLPVTLLLVGMGVAGFIYARQTMILQWEETALLRLQRAAHFIDMRLSRPKQLLRLYLEADHGHKSAPVRQAILEQLRKATGVVRINLNTADSNDPQSLYHSDAGPARSHSMLRHKPSGFNNHSKNNADFFISSPHLDSDASERTVSIFAEINDDKGVPVEDLEVVMDFHFLIEDLSKLGWWETRRSFLVDTIGRVLVGNSPDPRKVLGDTHISLESLTLEALKLKERGTVRGNGHPPDEISGFHRLAEAPWYIVVFSPGKEILKPITRFRNAYFITLTFSMLTILFLIRRALSRTTRSIQDISSAANEIARGKFADPLPVVSHDEIGELIGSFNTMSSQLKERIQLKLSLNLAKEVQQNLIPTTDPEVLGLDVAGKSLFCDETGGDYYDYIFDETSQPNPIRIVIGDVAGHGISSALLMSGVRASFRQRNATKGSLAEVIADVNRQVVKDVGPSGQFMTLFCLEIARARNSASWVRAGHEPALLYRRSQDSFDSLMGKGLPLGVDELTYFHEYPIDDLCPGDIFLLGTDGIWEATDNEKQMFGKPRVESILRSLRDDQAKRIVAAVFEQISEFTSGNALEDDITLVVVKIEPY